jgi:hypothetical protein
MTAPNYHVFGKVGRQFHREPSADAMRGNERQFGREVPDDLPREAGLTDESLAQIALTGKAGVAGAIPLNEERRSGVRSKLRSIAKKLKLAISPKPKAEEMLKFKPDNFTEVGSTALAKREFHPRDQIGDFTNTAGGWAVHTTTGRHFGPRLTQSQIEGLEKNLLRIRDEYHS